MHKFDIICISELYVNSDTSSNDKNLNIRRYNMSRADHPFENRRGEFAYVIRSLCLLKC